MGAVGLVARRDLQRRWRRLVLLTVLVGIVGAITLATTAGARRTSSTLERFRVASRAADIEIDGFATPDDVAKLAAIPGVAAVSALDSHGVVLPAAADYFSSGSPADTRFGTEIDRGRIVSGRAANPDAVDEVTIGEGLANRIGIRAGDVVDADSYSQAQVLQALAGTLTEARPDGPKLKLRVVGIVRRPVDLGETSTSGSLLLFTPAFARAHEGQIAIIGQRVRVRTDNGAADVPHVLIAARKLLGDRLFSVQNFTVETQGAGDTIGVIAAALAIVAAIAALAGLATIAIVLTRETATVGRAYNQLRDLGCTRGQLVAMSAPAAGIVAMGSAFLAIGGTVALSPLFPVGVARRAEPDIGIHADWPVIATGGAAIVATVFALAMLVAYRSTNPAAARALPVRGPHRPTLTERVTGNARPTIGTGIRMALEPGRRRSASPVRSAIVGVMIGALGVTAVGVFTTSLDQLFDSPAAYGAPWDFQVADATISTKCDRTDHGLAQQPGVATLTKICGQNVEIEGRPVRGLSSAALRGNEFGGAILAGRAPTGTREVALGATTLAEAGKRIGDTTRITGHGGTFEYVIVGQALLPNLGLAQPAADGAIFTDAHFEKLLGFNIYLRYYVGRYADGADRAGVARTIDAMPALASTNAPMAPVEVERLHEITWLPAMLVILFTALALVAVGHALVTSVRRRQRDLSLLIALGFTRGQVRRTVAVQATTLTTIGLVFGIPLGVVVGGFAWRTIADNLGVAADTTLPPFGVAIVIVTAIALANLIALLPARAAARTRPAVGLQAE